VSTTEKYAAKAEAWTRDAYADPASYLAARAELVRTLGPPLGSGDLVVDLACGDGGFAEFLLPHGLRYRGVDASEPMIEAARARLAGRADVELADLNDYRPPEPASATSCFRAIYYARERVHFFRQVASYTEKKLVFDLNPRQYAVDDVRADLVAAGLDRFALRPFFVPQNVALPSPLLALARAAERVRPLAQVVLRLRFSYVCAAWRSADGS
jgi:SAM-dependent methyltransferase